MPVLFSPRVRRRFLKFFYILVSKFPPCPCWLSSSLQPTPPTPAPGFLLRLIGRNFILFFYCYYCLFRLFWFVHVVVQTTEILLVLLIFNSIFLNLFSSVFSGGDSQLRTRRITRILSSSCHPARSGPSPHCAINKPHAREIHTQLRDPPHQRGQCNRTPLTPCS